VESVRFERTTSRMPSGCSTNLSYDPMVEATGIEPASPCMQNRCSTRLSFAPMDLRTPARSRTAHLLGVGQALFRMSYRGLITLELL
jgi:hypothetical protein